MMNNSALIAFVRIYNAGYLPLQYRIKVIFIKLFFKKFTSTPWGKHMLYSAWFNREKARKKDRDKRRDSQHCYKKLLRRNISTAINSAKKKFEEETLYKVEIRPDFSSIEVFVSHRDRKVENLLNLHFKLRACHKGVFLMYGARVKAQPNSPSTDSIVLYSKPEWISENTQKDTVMEWIEKAAKLNIQSLELTEYEAEIEMKKNTNAATNQQRRTLFCRLYRCFLRCLRFL